MFSAAVPMAAAFDSTTSFNRKGIQPSAVKPQPVTVRSKFPETWLWDAIDSGPDGKTSLRKPVPDTITSWVVTGFSISPEHGLGLSEDPTKIRVFRPFFVSLNLPYSVTRDESVAIPVNVFNYLDQEVTAEVTLENPGWFEFENTAAGGNRKKREKESSRTKNLVIGANSAATANFVVTPKKLGYLEVKATATSPLAGDGVSRKLLVKPEGETQYRTKGLLVDLREKNEFNQKLELDIPEDIVPESELIEVSAVGDLLGSAMSNLDRLIRQPYGCGEQNMLNFVPNIVILEYLTNSKLLTDSVESKSLKYMEMGYQRELTYKHKDDSFSAFGESDKSGSTWLTAFVAKSFAKAQKFIKIDTELILNSLKWLASQQAQNGSFPEVGHVSHKSMQGGGSKGLALTAYVLTAFVEAKETLKTDKFDDVISKAATYVNERIQEKESDDIYSVAVASYALNVLNHPAKDKAFELLESKSKTNESQKYWEKEKSDEDEKNKNPWDSWVPNAINVEITSYALLSYLRRGLTTESIPILKWLLAQQNSDGGFSSTQDTVVALGAIAQLAEKFTSGEKDVAITFNYAPIGKTEINVNGGNSLVLQKAELPSRRVREIEVDAKGKGFAVVQVSYRFNVNKKGAFPSFTLEPKVDPSSTKNHLLLEVCTTYVGGKESNMAVMEVTLPSGYTIDNDGIKSLKLTNNVKRVETKDDDTIVVLYFDNVTKEKLCASISADRTFKVAKQRPVPVTIYDYYDTSRRATEFYSPPAVQLCDICDGDDCLPCDNQL
ncbi:thioester-containing protein [Nesidiocoris tenuis]|nr:thioester-containing protein [Nesidiocoris tenuis]